MNQDFLSQNINNQNLKENGMEQEVYRVKEFCRKYAISRTSFYREVWADRLQTFKRGRCTFITRAEAERWLREQAYLRTKETMDKRYSAVLKST